VQQDGAVASPTDLDVALAAAGAGAAVVRAAYGAEVVRHAKAGLDFATNADVDAERAILDVIARERPEDARVGEESGSTGDPASRRWLVDPLCGTLNFAAQTPLVAVNVALVGGDAPVAVSADPIADEVFWTDGRRACGRHDGTDSPLVPSPLSRLVDVNCDGPADRLFVGPQLVADAAFRAAFGPRVVSTTLAVAWVAAGRRAGYVTDGRLADSVHFAAGLALCVAAGCVVTDLAGDSLGTGRGLVVAADPSTHARLLDLVRPHLAGVPGTG
jgi:myo-inositol-1(or 4)-monophosphatase